MKNLETIAEFLKKHNIAYSSTVACVWGSEMGIMELVVTHLDKTIVFTDAFADRVHMKLNGTDKVTVRVFEAIDYIKSVFDLDKPAPEPDLESIIKRLDTIEKCLDDMDKRITNAAQLAMLAGGSK